MNALSTETVKDLASMIRANFDTNAGFVTAEKWIRVASELGLTDLVKELKQDIKHIENAI